RGCSGCEHGGGSDNVEGNRVHFHDILPINLVGRFRPQKHEIGCSRRRGNERSMVTIQLTLHLPKSEKPAAHVRKALRVQLVTATLLVVYRQEFRSPRSSAGVD